MGSVRFVGAVLASVKNVYSRTRHGNPGLNVYLTKSRFWRAKLRLMMCNPMVVVTLDRHLMHHPHGSLPMTMQGPEPRQNCTMLKVPETRWLAPLRTFRNLLLLIPIFPRPPEFSFLYTLIPPLPYYKVDYMGMTRTLYDRYLRPMAPLCHVMRWNLFCQSGVGMETSLRF